MEELSFTQEIKREIIEGQKNKEAINAFLSGFVRSNGSFEQNLVELKLRDSFVLNNIEKFLKRLKYDFEKVGKKIILSSDLFDINIPDKNLHSFFAGVFCGSGLISDVTKTSYHLSFYTRNKGWTQEIANLFSKYEIKFKVYKEREKYVAYIKKNDQILDFLRAIQAIKAFFKIQEIKIKRDLENNINRLNNIDMSNLMKVAESSIKQIEMINFILKKDLLSSFNENQILFFMMRLENPELSLNELSHLLFVQHGFYITKGGLNHWLIKLKKIYEQNKDK
ncbi:DNA-binding protein WhiA [Mycoplasma sp. Ms02]|uniref:DNA-binding protein WhiA n=1 Tax=Mycoplasma sp. Ms02 TaxID=353851 RepID=UPI001C8A84FF|nr:DNA-binding protein WhiA [Mycoplasma sp. Ms02]QZE12316.1 DNA-binding protein WhiA [Mycoplasma sp. Ms02]